METPQRLTQLIDWHGSFEEKNKYLLWVENDLSTRTQNLLQLLKDVCAGLFCVTDNEQTMFYKSVFQLILQTQSKELIEFSNRAGISTCLASTQNGDNIAWCINSLLSTKLIDITRYKNLFKRVQSFHPNTDKRADVIMGFIFDWFWEKRKPDDTHGASPFQLIVDDFLKTPDSEEYYVGYLLRKFRQRAKYDLPTEHINTWLTDVAYIAENVIWLLSNAFYDLDYAKNIKHGLADNSAKFLENMTSVFGLFNFLEYVCNIKCDNGPLTFYKDSGPFFMDELFVTATRLLVKHDREFDPIIYSNLKRFRRLRPLWNEQTEDWKQRHFSNLIFRAITDTDDPRCFLYFITQYIAAENLRDLTSEMLKTTQIRDDKLFKGLERMYQWVKCSFVSLQTDFDHNAPIRLTYTIDAYVETWKFQPICRFLEKYFQELQNLNQNDQLAVFIQPIVRTFSKHHDILLAYMNKHIQFQISSTHNLNLIAGWRKSLPRITVESSAVERVDGPAGQNSVSMEADRVRYESTSTAVNDNSNGSGSTHIRQESLPSTSTRTVSGTSGENIPATKAKHSDQSSSAITNEKDGIKKTKAKCIYTLDDDENTFRLEMPCGHAISKEGLTEYCRHLLDNKEYTINCPSDEKCGAKWDYPLVRSLIELTPAEFAKFDTAMAENYLNASSNIQQCPDCGIFCKRLNDQDLAVTCPTCTREKGTPFIFCWKCRMQWISTSYRGICGNPGCNDEDRRLTILRNCSNSMINKVSCPSVRACPKCGMLINHIDRCKHVICKVSSCKHRFCFICLTPEVNGTYLCGSYHSQCTPAAIQTVLPASISVHTEYIELTLN